MKTKPPLDFYDYWSARARHDLPNSILKEKVITTVTLYATNRKWIANKTLEKWKKTAKDPLQPDKMADDTMYISKYKNKITMTYKQPLILDGKELKEYHDRNK